MPASANSLADIECQDLVEELADRMELDGPERAKFIHRCMTRAGYQTVPRYVKDDDNSDSDRDTGKRNNSAASKPRTSDDEWFKQ